MWNNFHCHIALPNTEVYAMADSIVIFMCRECPEFLYKLQLPAVVEKTVQAYLKIHTDFYKVAQINTLVLPLENKLLTVILAGCGEGKQCTPNNMRRSAGTVARTLRSAKAEHAVLCGPILLNSKRIAYVQTLVEGLYLGAYAFTKLKSKVEPVLQCKIDLVTIIPEAEKRIIAAEIIAGAICYTRDLVNYPGNIVTPQYMAEEALKLSNKLPVEVEVLDTDSLKAKGMNAILAVGQGSSNSPKLITIKYNGNADEPYIAFVGKGITFDSGGISLKPSQDMGEMKDDMSGAGAVLGAMVAIARLGLKCNVIGILSCAENMPGGRAQRPGDIVRAANGKTIEVVNTDAEGRMVLADAVWYACRMGAAKVIDIATLTGAVVSALGKETSGIVSNDDQLVALIKEAGKLSGENYWQLPSLPECREALKSDIADLLNSTTGGAGCITGGLFISEFIDEGIPWAHLDIGGTATATKTAGAIIKGGTAFGTMTLIKLAGLMACK